MDTAFALATNLRIVRSKASTGNTQEMSVLGIRFGHGKSSSWLFISLLACNTWLLFGSLPTYTFHIVETYVDARQLNQKKANPNQKKHRPNNLLFL